MDAALARAGALWWTLPTSVKKTHALMAMLKVREFGRFRESESFDSIVSSISRAVSHSPEVPQLEKTRKQKNP